jgi:transposase
VGGGAAAVLRSRAHAAGDPSPHGFASRQIRHAINSEAPPKYERAPAGSKLDPFKDEIHRLLKADSRMSGQRIRELVAEQGFVGGKTIVDDYLREVRPLFEPPRTFQRTI